jgi:hypothetical protein
MIESKVVVYTIDAPIYSSAMFGGTFELPFPRSHACRVNGSVLLISGGLYRSEDGDGVRVEVLATGLVQVALSSIGKRFGERAVLAMTSPDDPVMVVIRISRSMPDRWVNAARNAGFQVFQAGWALICLGRGSDLRQLMWLDDTSAWGDTCIFVGQEEWCPLQQSIAEHARSGEDGIELVRRLLRTSAPIEDATIIEDRMSRCRLIASLGGLEAQDLIINRNETDVTGLAETMMSIAEELDVQLYYAGNHADLESTGWFEGSEEWQPIPRHWIRKI